MKNSGLLKIIAALAIAAIEITARSQTNFLAASGLVADVQTAYNLAQSGSTYTNPNVVIIPAGSWTWTSQLHMTNQAILGGTGLLSTEIIDSYSGSGTGTIDIQPGSLSSIHFLCISNIWLHTTTAGTHCVIKTAGAVLGNDAPPHPATIRQSKSLLLRVTGCKFDGNWSTAIRPEGHVVGVIDHCQFSPSAGATGIYIFGEGDYSWDTLPPSWGDTNKLYVESCGFNWTSAAGNANGAEDSYNGARWCFRYNHVTNINCGCHGTDSSGTDRSTHSYEVYGNDFHNTTVNTLNLVDFRGGTGIFFSNTFTGSHINHFIAILNYRSTYTNIYGPANPPCCNPWGPITGLNPYDNNGDVYGNRPLDSIGATSPTDWTHFSNTLAPNGNPNGYVIQGSQPAYEWNNTNLTDAANVPFLVANNYPNTGSSPQISTAAQVIVSGRDFIDGVAMPGYTPLVFPHPLDQTYSPPSAVPAVAISGVPSGGSATVYGVPGAAAVQLQGQ